MATTKATEGTVALGDSRIRAITFNQEVSCTRCGGLMVRDFCTDLLGGANGLESPTSRCVQCGDVVDPVIRCNRHLQHEAGAIRDLKTSKTTLQGQGSI